MYITICETDAQSKFNARNRALKAGTPEQRRGKEWGGKGEGVQDGGGHVYTCGEFMSMYDKNHNIGK